jgi:hypothetical protein
VTIIDARTGLLVALGHLLAVLLALALLVTWVALGARLRRALGAGDAPAADAAGTPLDAMWRWPVDATVGGGMIAMVMLALGTAGALRPLVVLGVTIGAGIAVRGEWAAAVRELVIIGRGWFRGPLVELVPRSLALLLVIALLAAAAAPPTEWDSLMYHLPIPLWMLETGRIAVPPDSFHVALVAASHMATLPLLAARIMEGPALMQVLQLALLMAATIALAREAGLGKARGWLAVAIVLGCPVFVLVAMTARVDVALALGCVVANLVMFRAYRLGAPREVLLASVLVGIAIAIKPHAGAYAIALAPLGWRAAGGWRVALRGVAIAALIAAPWYIKNQFLVGAPLYPQGAPGWFEPWLAEIFGSRVPPAGFDLSVTQALGQSRQAFNLLDAFFAPGRLTIEGEGAFYALSPLLLLLPLAVLAWRRQRGALVIGLVGLAYAALVIVPFGRINLRYLMPAIPALAVATVAGLDLVAARLSVDARRLAAVAVVLAALWPLGSALGSRLGGEAILLRHAVGLMSEQETWRRHPDGTARSFLPVIENVRQLVPEDGRVLMLWEARTLPFGREMLADVVLSNWSSLAQSPALDACLAGTGITHILAGSGSLNYYLMRGAEQKAFHLDRFGAFRERCLTDYRVVGPGFEFFTVRRTPR